MNEEVFKDASVGIHYFDYSGYPVYKQMHEPFEHGVSIVDLLFNTGADAKKMFKFLNGK
jgi:hypothetical protein